MILDIVFCIFLSILGFNLKKIYSGYSKEDVATLNKLFYYHLVIGCVFYFYITSNGGDAQVYWQKAGEFEIGNILALIKNGSATGFILLLNYIPANILKLSFFTGCFFHIILGYWGIILFYNVIKESIPNYQLLKKHKIFGISIFPNILFLPNLHFWTSGLGKDTIVFFCVALFFYSINKIKKRFLGLIIGMVVGFFIRPHIILFLIISYGFVLMIDSKIKVYQKIIMSILVLGLLIALFERVMNFVNLESLDTQAIESYSNEKATALSKSSGSSVDISSYPYPLKVLTFLYRPFFFDINGALAIISSFENLLLVIFTYKVLKSKPVKRFKEIHQLAKAVFFFFLIGSLTFSMILGNLGIILRQKVPFIFCLIVFGMAILANRFKVKKVRVDL